MASSTTSPFPPFPLTGIQFPSSPIIISYEYTKQYSTLGILNRVLRSAVFCLLLQKEMPQFSKLVNALDVELVVVSCLLHNLTWTKKKGLMTNTRRFEVDSVNLTRHFLDTFSDKDVNWSKNSRCMQIIWDSIALQMMEILAPWKEPEVAPVHYGISGGPNLHLFRLPYDLPNLRGVMIDEKFKEISRAFLECILRKSSTRSPAAYVEAGSAIRSTAALSTTE